MFCNKCGNKIDDDMKFCPKCGNKIDSAMTEKSDDQISMLTIERKMGLFFAGMTLTVRVDGNKTYDVRNGSSVQIPLTEGPHILEAGYGGEYKFSCQINSSQTKKLTVNIAKPSGMPSLLMDGQVAPVAPSGSNMLKSLAGKMAGVASNVAKNTSDSISKAVGPAEFNVPEGGVIEPDEYDNLGTHIEVVAMPSANGIDAKRPYVIVTIDNKYPYFFKDGEKINIPVEPGQHNVSFRTRESKGEIVVNIEKVAFVLIKTAVSMKVAVTRTIEQVTSLEKMKPYYANSILAEPWGDIKYYVEKFGLAKNYVGVIFSDRLLVINEDGSKEEIEYYNLYKAEATGPEEVKFVDINGATKAVVKLPILGVIRSDIVDWIKEVNADNPEYEAKRKADYEADKDTLSYKLSFGVDERILVSERLEKFRHVSRKGEVLYEGNLASIVKYELYQQDAKQQSVMGEAMIGGYIAGRAGAAVSAINAQNNNRKISAFQVWLSVESGNDIKVLKVRFTTSDLFKGDAKHENCVKEYSRFDSYMKDRTTASKQEASSKMAEPITGKVPDPTEELRKYKSLLDDGIITQEDFDAKKKQLLGI